MSILIFIIVLGVLIFVHELGHFLAAKKSGIRVDEFAVGFPPKIFSIERGGTKYSLNLIPFGGYVKIYGENSEDESVDPNAKDSFVNKSPWTQAAVLVAGVTFNILFAWFLFFITLMSGMPTVANSDNLKDLDNLKVSIVNVYENSPADKIGLKVGDEILSISNQKVSYNAPDIDIEKVQEVIAGAQGPVNLKVNSTGPILDLSINPEENIISDKKAIGISLEKIGTFSLPPHKALYQSFVMTGNAMKLIAVGLFTFIGQAITGNASLDQVSGPVGIVGIVGEAAGFGIIYLLGFTAFISINLAILNILPLPALDGGRLVIVLIESVIRRKIKPSIVNWVNGIGFMLLILLMVIITINDVVKLF